MRKTAIAFLFFSLCSSLITAQGFNHQWLLGNQWAFATPKARISFDSSSYLLQTEYRKMVFESTDANICDANGNFLMSSNGVWIANANNDTMLNGSGLNPGSFVNSYPHGLLIPYGNIIVPYPSDSNNYVLFHQTGTFNGNYYPSNELFYSIIDMTLDSGRGGVDTIKKNVSIFQDTINWGISVCKHANGRDWWIVAIKDSTDLIYKVLFTPNGVQSISTQHLNVPIAWGNVMQPTFSQQGDKFAYCTYQPNTINSTLLLFDFDRCTGMFSNQHVIALTTGTYLWGMAFSASGNFIYTCTTHYIFQVNTSTLQSDTVATYDGFSYPIPNAATIFGLMYLAANGKIYITSLGSVQHIHEMNFPDSAGMACDVQQHNIFLNIWHFRSVPNHPNYYLGRLVGSPCDTVWQSIEEQQHDFRFKLYPNPISNNNLSIGYLLPQNKSGVFPIYDITGKQLFKYTLPQWSNEQSFSLPALSNGVYNCVITSPNGGRGAKKLVVIN